MADEITPSDQPIEIAITVDPKRITSVNELLEQTAKAIRDLAKGMSNGKTTEQVCQEFSDRFFSECVKTSDEKFKGQFRQILTSGMKEIEVDSKSQSFFDKDSMIGRCCSFLSNLCNKVLSYVCNRDDFKTIGIKESMVRQDLGLQLRTKTFENLYASQPEIGTAFIQRETVRRMTPQEIDWTRESVQKAEQDPSKQKQLLDDIGLNGLLERLSSLFVPLDKLLFGGSGPGSQYLPGEMRDKTAVERFTDQAGEAVSKAAADARVYASNLAADPRVQAVASDARDVAHRVAEGAKHLASDVERGARDVASRVAADPNVQAAVSGAKDLASAAVSKASAVSQDVARGARDVASRVAADPNVQAVAYGAKDLASKASAVSQDLARKARKVPLREIVSDIKDATLESAHKAGEHVKRAVDKARGIDSREIL